MVVGAIDESQRRAAKVAGFAYLLSLPFVIFAHFGISARLIVTGDAAATARNIVAHERLFRVGIVCNLIYSAGVVVLLAALYVILKRVDENLSLLAACGRLIYALTWIAMTLNLFAVLRLLNGPDYLRVFGAEGLPVFAKVYLSGFDAYYVALLFYGLGATVSSYLWFRSRYIPRALAASGIASCLWCAACTLVFLVLPDFTRVVNLWWFDSPMGIFEVATSLWLLFKGLRRYGADRAGAPVPDSAV
jgi:Domain of unknown function (DUF4386)